MSFAIRPYHLSDLCALYTVCLKTGDAGQDASHLYKNGELFGHVYVAPYVAFEPELAFVLTHHGAPVGYVLGTRDSVAFAERSEREWYPVLRQRYPLPAADDHSPDAGMIRALHRVPSAHAEMADYPAHLHIDLLPVGQGQGWGRRLIEIFLDRLRQIDVPAVHLGVAIKNERAIGFYERLGFTRIVVYEEWGWIGYGMKL